MKAILKAVPVMKSEKLSKDGKDKYYNVGLVQDGSLMEFSTTPDVYNGLNLYNPQNFELTLTRGEYQGKVYERKSITAILK